MRSGLPITEPWKFYYVTSLDLLITTRDNFVTAAGGTELMETLKGKFLGCGFLGYGFPSIHLPFLTLAMKAARYGILTVTFHTKQSQESSPKPQDQELTDRKHAFIKNIK